MDATTTLPMSAHHMREVVEHSAIDVEVARERGYTTVDRPLLSGGHIQQIQGAPFLGSNTREILAKMGFPSWAIREAYYFPGMWIPQYTPRGQKYAGQFKPARPVHNRDGKAMRYASAKGSARLDVHPRWSADRGAVDPTKVPAIQDPTMRLWITEGVKKADSLTSRGEVTVALSGVYNWRNTHASLGDWEDVRLRGREVVICFDADAITKPAVAKAMERLGKWLKYKGAAKVWYCVVPPAVNSKATKGVDDFFAAGGHLKELERCFEAKPPRIVDTADAFTDSRLAETLANEVLDGFYVWAAGLDWLAWDGRRWAEVHEVTVLEGVRQWALDHFAEAAVKMRDMEGDAGAEVEGWRSVLSSSRQRSILNQSRGIIERRAEEFDSDPDILNTPSGIVNLPTGELLPHDPDVLCTKITSGSYRPGFRQEDWNAILQALPEEVMEWLQVRIGQAISGWPTTDGVIPVLQGTGENGKGTLITDGILPAIGGYASVASPKLFMSTKNEHSTERADLRGQRLVIAEELTEGRSIDVTALKQVADVGRIKARRTHKDNMEFDATHSIFTTTNYIPIIQETDHGTWRRLVLVKFPYTFVKQDVEITDPEVQRRGDPMIKIRIKKNEDSQHDAIVSWCVEGAKRWYDSMQSLEEVRKTGEGVATDVMIPPKVVQADTLKWRMEADRILGFWSECLIASPQHYVPATELLEHFNAWLAGNNHNPWSKETFGPRFGGHSETTRNRVRAQRVRSATTPLTVDRRPPLPGGFTPACRSLPGQLSAWTGVRYRTESDDDAPL